MRLADEVAALLRDAATKIEMLGSSWAAECDRAEKLERELLTRPTEWSYQQACNAAHHWRAEAHRLAALAGVEPRRPDSFWVTAEPASETP